MWDYGRQNNNFPNWSYTTSAGSEPVTYTQAAAQCRIDTTDDQTLVTGLITVARIYAENYMGMTLVPRDIEATFYWQCGRLYLPRGPVNSITSIVDANSITIDPSTYRLRKYGNADAVFFTGSMPLAPISVTYAAGFSTVPQDICQGILLHVGQLYENREAGNDKGQTDIAHGLQAIYDQYRIVPIVG
jgi:uncharacterized phiE125 gp8 family phage protein